MGVERFGRYKVTGSLGAGAMGSVYAAVDEVLGREVAVKTLRSGSAGLGARILDERFRMEARAIAALSHPSIVHVYDIDLAADPPYLVMERVRGPSLKERFEAGPLPEHEVRALGIQIARALGAAHAAGIVHRDVKPANILVAGTAMWKLADFGVAHVPDSSLTITGQFIGSPAYAPPEALVRGQSNAAGDVFGLGATLYFAAAGTWPRANASTGAPLAPVPSLRELAPALADDLITTIDRAVSIDPDRRPSAAELADALASAEIFVAPSPSPSIETVFVPDAPASRDVPTVRWRRWAIALGVGVIGVAIAIGVAKTRSQPAAVVGSDAAAVAQPIESEMPAEPELPAIEDPPPGQIRVVTPQFTDRRAAEDWERLVDNLYDRKFDDARDTLGDWEHRWGETEETRSLHRQLDAIRQPDE